MEKVGERLEGGRCGMGSKMFENCKKFPHLNLYVSFENKWFFLGGEGSGGHLPQTIPLGSVTG